MIFDVCFVEYKIRTIFAFAYRLPKLDMGLWAGCKHNKSVYLAQILDS